MTARRPFLSFIVLRLSACAIVACLALAALTLVGLITEVSPNPFLVLALVLTVSGFFEYDSLPRRIGIDSGILTIEDASGEITSTREYGFKRLLWLPRVVCTRDQSVVSIPLEAYRGTWRLMSDARSGSRLPTTQRAEQVGADQPATAPDSKAE
jgi:hypothetical protein